MMGKSVFFFLSVLQPVLRCIRAYQYPLAPHRVLIPQYRLLQMLHRALLPQYQIRCSKAIKPEYFFGGFRYPHILTP